LDLDKFTISKDIGAVTDRRTDVAGPPTTMNLDMIPLADDGVVVDDDVGRSLDKNDGDEAMATRVIDIFPYHR
jgi:hypothetical protein